MNLRVVIYLIAVGVGLLLLVRWLARSAERPASGGSQFSPSDPGTGGESGPGHP